MFLFFSSNCKIFSWCTINVLASLAFYIIPSMDKINDIVIRDAKILIRNILCYWVDVRKAFDSLSHSWLVKLLEIHRFPRERCLSWNQQHIINEWYFAGQFLLPWIINSHNECNVMGVAFFLRNILRLLNSITNRVEVMNK